MWEGGGATQRYKTQVLPKLERIDLCEVSWCRHGAFLLRSAFFIRLIQAVYNYYQQTQGTVVITTTTTMTTIIAAAGRSIPKNGGRFVDIYVPISSYYDNEPLAERLLHVLRKWVAGTKASTGRRLACLNVLNARQLSGPDRRLLQGTRVAGGCRGGGVCDGGTACCAYSC